MENHISTSLSLLSPNPTDNTHCINDFNHLFSHLNTIILSKSHTTNPSQINKIPTNNHKFCSATISLESQAKTPEKPLSQNWLKPTTRDASIVSSLLKNLTVFERALIGAGGGGIAGAFTYVCLHPLDTIKTKLQTKGASEIYNGAFDAIAKTFQSKGILGFYSGVSAVIVGSTFSSAVYFGTCEFGKSVLSKFGDYPAVLIPPTAGAMGNIVSSAIMVPKELITQRMQTGAKGRSWEVLMKILDKDGFLGLYAGTDDEGIRNTDEEEEENGDLPFLPLWDIMCSSHASISVKDLTVVRIFNGGAPF